MKAALLICGQPRTMEFCYPSIKAHILDVYKPDVFICSDEQKERLVELFNPVNIDIRTQEEIDIEIKVLRGKYVYPKDEIVPHKDLSISWKVYRAAQMKREYESLNGFEYDVVFITRFDVKFKSIQEVREIEENKIYVPKVGAYWYTPPDTPGIHWHGYSTHLCWMSSQVADKISRLYFFGENNYQLASVHNKQWGYIPEHVLKFFCDRNHIKAEFVDIEMMLIRGTNDAPLSFHNQYLTEFPEYA